MDYIGVCWNFWGLFLGSLLNQDLNHYFGELSGSHPIWRYANDDDFIATPVVLAIAIVVVSLQNMALPQIREPQYRPQNTIHFITGTLRWGILVWEDPHMVS